MVKQTKKSVLKEILTALTVWLSSQHRSMRVLSLVQDQSNSYISCLYWIEFLVKRCQNQIHFFPLTHQLSRLGGHCDHTGCWPVVEENIPDIKWICIIHIFINHTHENIALTIFLSVNDKSFSERSDAFKSRGGWCWWQSKLFFDRYQWLSWYRNITSFIGQIVSEETALLVTVRQRVPCNLSLCWSLAIDFFLRRFLLDLESIPFVPV